MIHLNVFVHIVTVSVQILCNSKVKPSAPLPYQDYQVTLGPPPQCCENSQELHSKTIHIIKAYMSIDPPALWVSDQGCLLSRSILPDKRPEDLYQRLMAFFDNIIILWNIYMI